MYQLSQPEKGIKKEFFVNFNLLKSEEIKIQNTLCSPDYFHSLQQNSEFTERFKNKRLTDLKIPYNDILMLHNEDYSKEFQLEFNPVNIFKN